MDIIGHLSRTVTPKILGANPDEKSKGLLEEFYAIFAARLADEDTYGRVSGQEIAHDDKGFFDRVWTDDAHRSSISRELASGHSVDESAVRDLVLAATPVTYNELSSLSGSTPVPQFLRDNLSTYRERIPTWATTIIPAGILVAEPAGERISQTTTTAPLVKEEKEEGSFLKALLPIIGLLILAALAWALLKACDKDERVVTEPVAVVAPDETNAEPTATLPVGLTPASLSIASGEDNILYACQINAGNDGLQGNIMSAISDVFGDEANKCRSDVDDAFATDMEAASALPAILQVIRDTPHASAIIKGDTIAINANDPEILSQLVDDIKAAAPNLTVIAEGPLDIENEINNSLTAAGTALDSLDSSSDPEDVARALSLQVINFELDKAFIPEVNKPLLDRAANIINETPDLKLLIIGHTDALASDAYNMNLSRERSASVKDYLVAQGVDADKLVTEGRGESEPIATNETERGRFRNRRIEFKVYDETINGDGIVVAPDVALDPQLNNGESSSNGTAVATAGSNLDPDLNPLDNNNDDVMPDGDDPLLNADPDLNPLDNNNDDVLPDGDDPLQNVDPDLNPLDNNNDDVLPDGDDHILGN